MAHFNFEELLTASKATQTSGIQGAGSPLLFIGAPGTTKTGQVRSFCDSVGDHCEVIIMGRIPIVDVGGIYVPDIKKGELRHLITKRLLGEMLTLIRSKGTGRPEASPGYHDDACVAFAIAMDVSRIQSDQGVPAVRDVAKVDPGIYSSLVQPYSNVAAPSEDFPEGDSSWF